MTDLHDIVEHGTTLAVGDLDVPCVEVRPQPDAAGRAGVVVIHDIFGLTEVTRGHAARLAAHGYVTVAPNLFGLGRSKPACVVRTMGDFRRRSGTAWDVLEAATARLVAAHGVDRGRIGVMGFCMGAGFALLLAQRENLAVAAPFYGEAPTEVLEAAEVCPVIGGWGERDLLFRSHGRRLRDHLRAVGVDHDIALYPDAGHSYMDDHRGALARLGRLSPMGARYDQASADDSWARVLTFFATHL